NVVNVHVTLVPYIRAARELKTKPTQQSIAKLREIGIQPQVLLCRTEHPLDAELRQKLSMFCNVSPRGVIEARDVEHTIYEMPLMLNAEGLDDLICELLHIEAPPPNLANWRKFVERVVSPKKQVKIAVVVKYIDLQEAYKSIKDAPDPVICLLEEQRDVKNKGATMRLGTWPTRIAKGTVAQKIYGNDEVLERHRHRYEFNMKYREEMGEKGFTISGTSPDGSLAELIELRDHPYFLACQYHPEFQSKPNKPHPLFKGFIEAAIAHKG